MRLPQQRYECLFGRRVVSCYAERASSVYEIFARAVAARGDAEALVCEGQRLSYRDLSSLVDQLAVGLSGLNVKRGDRVAIWVGNRPEFITILGALLKLGAIAVPLSTRLQTPEVTFILDQCSANVLIYEASLTTRLPDMQETPELIHRIEVGTIGDVKLGISFSNLFGDLGPCTIANQCKEEDTAMILYTSGTTGRPKGAMLTHVNIVHTLINYQQMMELSTDDRSVLAVPASHVTGMLALIMTAWQAQSALVMMPEFKARDFLNLIEKERITHTIIVPAMYNLCLLQPDFEQYDLASWRVGGFGGAPMPAATIAEFARKVPGLGLRNVYGSTETSSPVTMMPASQTALRPDSVGLVLPGVQILVMDPKGIEVELGEAGELWIAGPMVIPGYWENPQATEDSFVAGYWRSGDIGSIDAEGFVRVFDRVKDMINRGGYKIYSLEVENVLCHHSAISECAVVGKYCEVLGERVMAHIKLRTGQAVTAEALRIYCLERLADYKVPESFIFSDSPLPRNANGKLLKRTLRDQTDPINP